MRVCRDCSYPLPYGTRNIVCAGCRVAHYGHSGLTRERPPGRIFPASMKDLPADVEDGVRGLEDGDCGNVG